MQLKSLNMLVTVAKSGSFVAAAEQLHTVQSNVTAHVKKLEDELGVQLLLRKKSRAVLTPAGRELMGYAEQMLRLHDEACQMFQQDHPHTGVLRIGAMETTMALRLPPVLAQFHAEYPQIDLQLQTGPTAQLSQQLLEGALDCVFVAGGITHPEFVSTPVFTEHLVLVSARPLQELPSYTELLGATFVAFRQGCSYRHRIELFLAANDIAAARVVEFGTLEAILGCVVAGMGYALLPEATVQAYQSRYPIHYHPLPQGLGLVETHFVTPKPPAWSPALSHFVRTLEDVHGECAA
ncbi:LysR substrate-binding domain-containing protein [Photobacterium sp. MCCC 1A19761]|uniref:LysR family transcriptional regulator n=1 Tax=Photobacterium sp. MCCC 1A19761 TaxID=3115000 RepID=UPI00307F68D8